MIGGINCQCIIAHQSVPGSEIHPRTIAHPGHVEVIQVMDIVGPSRIYHNAAACPIVFYLFQVAVRLYLCPGSIRGGMSFQEKPDTVIAG